MSDPTELVDEQLNQLLVEFDEGLVAGNLPFRLIQSADNLTPAQHVELQEAQDCLQWLETLLPRTESSCQRVAHHKDATDLVATLHRWKDNAEPQPVVSLTALRTAVVHSEIISERDLEMSLADLPFGMQPTSAEELAFVLVQRNILTVNQALILCRGELKSLLLGDYLIQRQLGAGGMGTVYEALHRLLDKRFALKVLPAGAMQSEVLRARFRREMLATGKLEHVNIVRATDAREDSGICFLVMEAVPGVDVGQLVARYGPLPIGAACEIVRQTAIGLDYIHHCGLVHRDIKPANLMVATTSSDNSDDSAPVTVKILDLGLAALRNCEAGLNNLTENGLTMGTADYMAPEQFLDAREADGRADLYSLGCTFYVLLTGLPPFGGKAYDTMGKKTLAHAEVTPPAISLRRADVPAKLADIIERMVAKKPGERFSESSQVADAVAGWACLRELGEVVQSRHCAVEARDLFHAVVETGKIATPAADTEIQPQHQQHNLGAKKRYVVAAFVVVVLLVIAVGPLTIDLFNTHHATKNNRGRQTDLEQQLSSVPIQIEVAREPQPVAQLDGNQSSDAMFGAPQIIGHFQTKNARGVQVVGTLAYVADFEGGLRIIDVADPAHPKLTGTFETEGQCEGLQVLGDLAYLADRARGLFIIDVSQPAHCTLVRHIPEARLNDIRLNGEYAYGADQSGFLRIYYVADPRQASLIHSVQTLMTPNTPLQQVKIVDNLLYLSHDRGGLLIFDLSDPRQPKQLGSLNLPDGQVMSVVVVRDLAYLGHGGQGLTIVDVRYPSRLRVIANLSLDGFGTEVFVRGRYVYALNQKGLKVVDVSDPIQPLNVAQVDTPEVSVGLDVVGDTVYIADRFAGLQIVALNSHTSVRSLSPTERSVP